MHATVGERLHVTAVLLARPTRYQKSSRSGDQVGHLRTWCAAATGMRPSCSSERIRPWSTDRT